MNLVFVFRVVGHSKSNRGCTLNSKSFTIYNEQVAELQFKWLNFDEFLDDFS